MITEGSQNMEFGQFQEVRYNCLEDIRFRVGDKYIYIQDETLSDVLRFKLDNGLLKYSVFSGGVWQAEQTLTTVSVAPEDSTTLPHNPANTRIDISADLFRVYLQNVLYLQLSTSALTAKLSELQLDNATYDLVIKMKAALGQKFVVQNSDSSANMLEVSQSQINVLNKPVLGVASSNNATSAVNLQQLQAIQPQALQAKAPSNEAVIYNTQNLPIAQFTSNDVVLKKPARYDPRPANFQSTTLTDVQQVQTILADYQPLAAKDQSLGYAGLDTNARIYSNALPTQSTVLNGGQLQTALGSNISTSAIAEGSSLYYTDARVNTFLDSVKGIANGVCPLNASAKVPAQFIDSLSLGGTFSGIDAQKTSQLNPAYAVSQPIQGDQYIATDTGTIYILKDIPFTTLGNWVMLTQGGVTSVNGLQGVVSLSTDNIGEGIVNKYFASGINTYKSTSVNQPNELIKLDAQGVMDSSLLGTSITLQGGFATISDNQSSHLRVIRASDQDLLLDLDNAGFTLGRKATYETAPLINSALDIPDKQYVDNSISAFVQNRIATQDTEVLTAANSVTTTVQDVDVQVATQSQISAKVPVVYDNVTVTQAQQLATKQYVDNTLANFINVSGAAKQYLQATSNVPITTNGRITNWNVNIQSTETSRLSLNPVTSVFNVKDKTYRFYLGVQIKEFTEVDLVEITVQLRDAITQQPYFYYDFSNDFSSTGGDQALSMSLPFIWKFVADTQLEVYVQSSQTSFGVYNAYIMIEEFQNFEFATGLDRITDPGAFSKLQIASHSLDFNINGADKMQLTTNALVLEPNIRILQDASTANSDPQQLVPKSYVDEQVNLANVSISKTGQVIQASMSANQVINVGQTVQFNTTDLNTSITMTCAAGLFTFTQGFVYKISYKVNARFLNGGTAQVIFRDAASLATVPGSVIYITYNSQDTSSTTATFYLDLRAEVASKSYNVVLLSATNLQQIYKNFTLFTAEQVQIINDLFFDRIETPGQVSQLKLYQEEVNYKLDGDLVAITSNDSQNFKTQLQVADKNFESASTNNSTYIENKTTLANPTSGIQRGASISASVASDVSVAMGSAITSAGDTSAYITAPLADRMDIGTSNVALHITDTFTTANQVIAYDNAVVPTNAKHLIAKEYADNNFYTNITTLNNITAPTGSVSFNNQKLTSLATPTANSDAATKQYVDSAVSGASATQIVNTVNTSSKLVAAQTELTNGTTPLNMNSQKITSLATPTANSDAATKQYVDNATSGVSGNQIVNAVNANSKLVANQTELTNGTTPLNMNSYKITSLADATAATDALNRQTGDGRYYQSTTTLNSITAPTAALSLNSQKITSLADATAATDALNRQTADARYYTNNKYFGFKVLLGDVPFTSGSTNTVYPLAINGTNVPINQSSVITAIDWVRQTARTDTVRLRFTLDNAIINQRVYQVLLTPETTYANASGGPSAEWRFGDSTENYVLQTFGIDYSANPKFFVHARDISAANTQSLLLNGLIIVTETSNVITPPISTYVPYYTFTLNIGDIPSGVQSYTSTNNVITNVQYINYGANTGGYLCTVNSAAVFGGADYSILLTYRSIRGSVSSADNDLQTPVVAYYDKVTFQILLEELSNQPVQNVAVDGILVKRV